jgi:hypothetical protein
MVSLSIRLIAEGKTPHPAKAKPPVAGKQNAEQLLDDADKALALTVKSARAAGKELDGKTPVAKPFYQSLKDINSSIEDAKKSLAAKDNKFFDDLSAAKAASEDMKVNFELTKSKNPQVITAGKALSGAITALHDNYSPMEQRKLKGGELTAEEKKNFQKLKADQEDLLKKVHALSASVKNDPALKDGLKEISAKAHEIAKAPETVSAYADSVDLASTVIGLIDGLKNYVNPGQRSQWEGIQSYTQKSPSYYTTGGPAYSYDWSYTTSSVPVYDSFSSISSEVSSSEMTSEDSYLESSNFEESAAEEDEVAEESDSISDDEAESAEDEMDSGEEEADDSADEGEMGDDGGDDGGSDEGGDDDGGDDRGGDDGGGE